MEAEWKPTRWWRVTAPDGSIWAESSDEQECRELKRPGDTLARLEQRTEQRWVEVEVTAHGDPEAVETTNWRPGDPKAER